MKLCMYMFFQVIYHLQKNIPFPFSLCCSFHLCWIKKKSPYCKDQLCLWLSFLKKYVELLVCITSEGWNIHQIANFPRSEIMFFIPLEILCIFIEDLQTKQLLNSCSFRVSNSSSLLNLISVLEQSSWAITYFFYTY